MGTGVYPKTGGGSGVPPSQISSVFGAPGTPHDALLQIGAELAAVAVTVVIAGTGPKAGRGMVALWGLLWLLFLITYYA